MVEKVIWTPRATVKLRAIIRYLELNWNEKVTREFAQKTFASIQLISDQPTMGELVDEKKQIRGFRITKHNRLFYTVVDKELIVLNMFDNRQSPKNKRY